MHAPGITRVEPASRIGCTARPPESCQRIARHATDAKAHELAPGLWSLQLPLAYVSVASVNVYLLRAGDGWIMWDCGSVLAPGWDALEHGLALAGVRPGDVSTLIVSHAHTDHRGLAAEFLARSQAQLAASTGPHPMIDVLRDPALPIDGRRDHARREGIPEHALEWMIDELPGHDIDYPRADADRVLAPGDVVQTDAGPWEVFATPGHGADQIGMFNRANGWMLSADLAFPNLVSFLEYGTRPDPQADQVASLERALAFGPDLLLPGHGRPLPDAGAALRSCRQQVLQRVDRVLAAIGTRSRTAWEVALTLTPAGTVTDHYQRSMSEGLCVLEHLELTGRAVSTTDDRGRRVWQTTHRR